MRTWFALLAALSASVSLAQSPVEYDISFDNAVHHEARITVTWRDLGDAPLEMRMSRSSPGRYAIHEFGKNVYNVWVVDGDGDPDRRVRLCGDERRASEQRGRERGSQTSHGSGRKSSATGPESRGFPSRSTARRLRRSGSRA